MGIGFWFKLVKSNVLSEQDSEKDKGNTSVLGAVAFLLPLLAVRTVQKSKTIIINLAVSHSLSRTAGTEAAAEVLAKFAALLTLGTFVMNMVLIVIPDCSYFILHNVLGMSKVLAMQALLPLAMYAPICVTGEYCNLEFAVGIRAFCSGILIMNKQTKYLTPSAFVALLGLCFCLETLHYSRKERSNVKQLLMRIAENDKS